MQQAGDFGKPGAGDAEEAGLRHRLHGRGRWRKRSAALAVGLVFSGLCAFYLSQKISLAQMREHFGGMRVGLLVPAAMCVAASISLRGYRWGLMVPRQYLERPAPAIRPVAISLALNGVLPGRVGEIMRILYARGMYKLPIVSATTSVLAERLADMAVLCVLLVGALVWLRPEGLVERLGGESPTTMLMLGLLAIGGAMALAAGWFWWRRSNGARSGRKAVGGGSGFFETVKVALRPMRAPRTAAAVSITSLAAWSALVAANFLVVLAFRSMPLSLGEVTALTSVSIIASFLPSIPGAWGVFESSIVAVAPILGFAASDAELVSFGLTAHFVQYCTVLLMGGACGLIDAALYR